MRRVVAIGGILFGVAVVLWIARRDPSPTPDPTDFTDSDGRAPSAVTSSDMTSDGELRGGGTGRSKGAMASDAGPAATSAAVTVARPHLRRTVLDESGNPVAGARVEALAKPTDDAYADPELGAELGDARTDARGRMTIELKGDQQPAVLRVTAPGRPTTLFHAQGGSRTLRYQPTTRVSGRTLTRGMGVPIASVLIDARSSDPFDAMLRVGPFSAARSAGDGTFTLRLPGNGVVSLTARGPNSRSEPVEVHIGQGDTSDVILILDAPGEAGVAEGRVLVDGRPIAGVRIVLRASAFRSVAVASEATGVDGVYRIAPVWNGVEEVVIDASGIGMGRTRLWEKFELHDGRAERNVAMPRPWSVSGRVVRGPAGVADARISSNATLGGRESDVATATTDPSGSFRISGLFDRRPSVTLTVAAPDGDSAVERVDFDVEHWDINGVLIELKAFGRIRGRVLDVDARPIVGAHVRARSEVVSGSDGRFDVLADPGRTRVAVSCEGYVDRTSAWTQVPVGERGSEIDVVLQSGATISGHVRDRNGRGLKGAVIQVDGIGGIGGSSTVRSYADDGAFLSQIVGGSSFQVTVSADGFVTRVIEGVEPDTELADIVLEPSAKAKQPR